MRDLTLRQLDNLTGDVTLRDVTVNSSGQTGITNNASLHAERVQISSKQVGLRNGVGATAHVERSLIRANTAGGIVNDGTLELVDSTLTDNGAAGIAGTGSTQVSGSVLERQRSSAPSCAAPATSGGFNVTSDNTCGLSDPTDLVVTTGVLVPLDAPGAYTPISGTAAVDSGRPGCGPALDGTAVADGDGDGDVRCDRGAFEVGAPVELHLVVNATTDAADENIGDGVCETAVAGQCTLRAAIQEANRVPGADRIELSAGTTYPVPLSGSDDDLAAKGDLDVWGPVRIDGNGATIGQPVNPAAGDLFHIRAGQGVELDDVAMRNPLRAIRNEGGLTLRSVTATGMQSIVNSSGSLDIDGLTATANVNTSAFTNSGSMVLNNATVHGWASGMVNTGTVDLDRVDITGGVGNSGTLTARSSIILSTGTSSGLAATAGATTTLQESIVSGGLYALSTQTGSATSLSNSTLDGSASAVSGTGSVTATNSLFSGRSGSACTTTVVSGGYNAASDLTCGLAQPTDRAAVGLALVGPQPIPEYPELTLPLAIPEVVDGGSPGCAAVDLFGRPRTDSDGDGVIECERGAIEVGAHQPRTYTVNSTVDAIDASPGDGVCQTATAGQCTLRAAVTEANLAVGADTITLQALQTYRLDGAPTTAGELYSGDLDVWTSLTLRGSLSGIRDGAVDIHGGAVTVRDLYGVTSTLSQRGGALSLERYRWSNGAVGINGSATVTDGTVTDGSLGISARGTATVTRTPFNGSGGGYVIDNAGSLTVSQSVLALPYDPYGLVVRGSGSTSLDRVTIDTQDIALEQQGTATVAVLDSTLRGRVLGVMSGGITATNSVFAARLDTVGVCSAVALATGGWNLTDDPSGCGLNAPTDLWVPDAQMGPLQSNGGSMQSVLPMPGSAAIDTGRTGCTATDQRGKARPVDGDGDGTATCDRGANELGVVQPLTLTVTSSGDGSDANPGDGLCRTSGSVCTLRAAIMESNASNGPDTIVMTATPWLTQGQMAIGSELVIEGGSQAVYGGAGTSWIDIVTADPVAIRDLNLYDMNPYQALVNHRGTVTLHNVTVTYYVVINKGGSLTVEAGSDLADISGMTTSRPDGSGPVPPALTVTDSTVAQVDAPGSLTVERSTLESIWFTGTAGSIATSTIGKGNWGTAVHVASGTVSIVDSTLWSSQVAPYPQTLVNAGGSVSLRNSITTGCAGAIASEGYNLGCGADPTDITGVALLLGAIGDNGGPTQTFLPDATSPAVDSGAPTCGSVDQRGLPRPVGAACDRGAVERQ